LEIDGEKIETTKQQRIGFKSMTAPTRDIRWNRGCAVAITVLYAGLRS